jgi:hypothetical protein
MTWIILLSIAYIIGAILTYKWLETRIIFAILWPINLGVGIVVIAIDLVWMLLQVTYLNIWEYFTITRPNKKEARKKS